MEGHISNVKHILYHENLFPRPECHSLYTTVASEILALLSLIINYPNGAQQAQRTHPSIGIVFNGCKTRALCLSRVEPNHLAPLLALCSSSDPGRRSGSNHSTRHPLWDVSSLDVGCQWLTLLHPPFFLQFVWPSSSVFVWS